MRKILFVITKSNWGGAQKQVFELATHLPPDYEVSVAMGGTGEPGSPPGTLHRKLLEAGIPSDRLYHLGIGRDLGLASDIRSFFELFALFRREQPHIVHLQSSKIAAYGAIAARFAGIRLIVSTIHGWAFNEERPLILRALFYLAHYLGALASSFVIVINDADARVGRRMPFVGRKIRLIYNGLLPYELLPADEARKRLEEKYGIPRSVPLIGSIGELTRNKGYARALEAVRILKRQGIPFSYLIVGDGEDRKMLASRIAEEQLEGDVRLAGFLPSASSYMRAFDIFFLPSVKEGLPSVVLEAGYACLPVVAARIPGVTDILTDSTGITVESRDAGAMAASLGDLLRDPKKRASLGGALQRRVHAGFSFDSMLRELIRLYAS